MCISSDAVASFQSTSAKWKALCHLPWLKHNVGTASIYMRLIYICLVQVLPPDLRFVTATAWLVPASLLFVLERQKLCATVRPHASRLCAQRKSAGQTKLNRFLVSKGSYQGSQSQWGSTTWWPFNYCARNGVKSHFTGQPQTR